MVYGLGFMVQGLGFKVKSTRRRIDLCFGDVL